MLKLKTSLLLFSYCLLLALSSGCATFKEMARQRGEAMDACQPCPFTQGCRAQNCGNK